MNIAPTPGTDAIAFEVLQAFCRFNHGNCDKIALRIQRPNVGVLLVLSRGDACAKTAFPRE
jgi:hypothetical protein